MRAAVRIVVSVLCLWQLGCSTPQVSPEISPEISSSDFVARRNGSFAAWRKGELAGINPGVMLWDCALCPKLIAHNPGWIWAGAVEWDHDRQPNEPPISEVEIPRHFAISSHEVTRGEFNAFVAATNRAMKGGCHTDRMDPKASFRNPGFVQDDDHPVVCVSWQDARDYVAWLNSQTSGGYRLPTEAEWHFGGFGGGHALYFWGDDPEPACIYANVLDATAASAHPAKAALPCSDGSSATAPVGKYLPGASLTFDLIGNAAEWTDTCDTARKMDPAACVSAIVKGGSWKSTGIELRLAARNALPVNVRDNSVGFRVVKTLGDPDAVLTTAAAYLARGRRMLFLMDNRRAQVDFERAVKMEPRNSHALSARGWVHFRTEKNTAASDDFNAALALDPSNAEAIAGLGALALFKRDPQEALRQLDRALALEPGFGMAISIRASAHWQARESEQALADSAQGLRLQPNDIDLFKLRVYLRVSRREWPQAIDEVDRLSRAFPTMDIMQNFAADAYSRLLQDDDAWLAANRALRSNKSSENYLLRASVRPWEDFASRRFDIQAALVADPNSLVAIRALGELESRAGNHEAALRSFNSFLERETGEIPRVEALMLRGIELIKLGDSGGALKDFEAALGPKPKAVVFNNLCWKLTLADVALERAMEYCNRALAASPGSPSYLDSKGTLLLRLKKWDEAIKAYDQAIKLAPNLANSLYGRGIASQSRCQCEAGIADLESALQAAPTAQRAFERVGIVAPYPQSIKTIERIRGPSSP